MAAPTAAALDALADISDVLDTGLGRDELSALVSLIDAGVNPEARR